MFRILAMSYIVNINEGKYVALQSSIKIVEYPVYSCLMIGGIAALWL